MRGGKQRLQLFRRVWVFFLLSENDKSGLGLLGFVNWVLGLICNGF